MRISADYPYTVEYEGDRWRLVSNGTQPETALVEARPGGPLRFDGAFGAARRLPDSGEIALSDVERIVAGWSPSDSAWHLGLLLRGSLAEQRASRWCELAAWHDETAHARRAEVEQAGQMLAARIGLPFALVPPKTPAPADAQPAPSAYPTGAPVMAAPAPAYPTAAPMMPARAARPLAPLPIAIDGWQFAAEPGAPGSAVFVWARVRGGALGQFARALWYLFWAGVAFILSYASLVVPIWPTTPEFLPLLGLVCTVVLVALSARTAVRVFTRPTALRIDGPARTAQWLRGRRVLRTLDLHDADTLFVTETVSKGNPRQGTRTLAEAEYTAGLADGGYRPLFRLSGLDERIALAAFDEPDQMNREAVFALDPDTAHTATQHAALHMAAALRVQPVGDRRVR